MLHRIIVILAFFSAATLSAQSVAEMEVQLQQATANDQRWELTYRLSKNWLITDTKRAAAYAKQSLQLATTLNDKRREAESAWISADIAERQVRPAEALALYEQTYRAATTAALPDMQLQAGEKLQTLSAKQGNFKAAYDWSRQRTALLQEKSRLYAEEQRKKYEAAQAALEAQKKRENGLGMALLAVLGIILTVLYYLRQRANRRTRGEMAEKNAMIEEKRRRSEQLLLNILPPAVAAELTVRNKVAARRYEHATVMFIDFVGFTKTAERLQPEELVAELDYCFSRFDDLIGRNRIEKIKTVGDAYICASGLSDRNERPSDMIKAALQIQDFLKKFKEKRLEEGRPFFEARIGIHFGPVVAGVVGTKKFAYDIWGDTVNTAARLEEACEPGRINVSGTTRDVVLDEFQWEYRGKVAAKNKGEMEMYYLV
ncbi:MAG: adenylate/guanylate cyclase domain-containing protein [Saprospiraceae bacterium]|nr:adenylate/guanylate cyclase domain-containing protein [Saprospiraceae bacterium]